MASKVEELRKKIELTKSNKYLSDKHKEMYISKLEKEISELEKLDVPADVEKSDKKEKKERKVREPKKVKEYDIEKEAINKKNPKPESKIKIDYDCDELIKEAKERHSKAKEAAKKRSEQPKKTEATKAKEKIEKVEDTIEKRIEKGKYTKTELVKLINETKALLKLLENALKKVK